MKVLQFLYQWLIAVPILLVLTVFTAIFTVLTSPWRNAEFVHREQQFWSRCFFWLFGNIPQIEGVENLQKGQSYVFVCNHVSLFDVWLVYGWLPVVFKWIMKQELRKVPFVGSGCYAAGHIFIDRRNPRAAKESLERAKSILKDGVSLVVFPEGTRSKNGEVQAFKRGAFQLAQEFSLPIVPITINGAFDVLPRTSLLPFCGSITLKIHDAIAAPSDEADIKNKMAEAYAAVYEGLDDKYKDLEPVS